MIYKQVLVKKIKAAMVHRQFSGMYSSEHESVYDLNIRAIPQ